MNYIVETATWDGDKPVVGPTTIENVGQQPCGCCFVFKTRREAKVLELEILRAWQNRINAELADCENRIVTVMRELENN